MRDRQSLERQFRESSNAELTEAFRRIDDYTDLAASVIRAEIVSRGFEQDSIAPQTANRNSSVDMSPEPNPVGVIVSLSGFHQESLVAGRAFLAGETRRDVIHKLVAMGVPPSASAAVASAALDKVERGKEALGRGLAYMVGGVVVTYLSSGLSEVLGWTHYIVLYGAVLAGLSTIYRGIRLLFAAIAG